MANGDEIVVGLVMAALTIIVGISLLAATLFVTHKMIEGYRARLDARNREKLSVRRRAAAG